jgi:hypothetical protein
MWLVNTYVWGLRGTEVFVINIRIANTVLVMEVAMGHQPSRDCDWGRSWRDIEWRVLVVTKTRTERCVPDQSREDETLLRVVE